MRKPSILWLATVFTTVTLASAQAPGPGARHHEEYREFHGHDRQDRMERMIEYLDLSEDQAEQWQAMVESHKADREARRDRVEALRQEFRELADQQDPNLEELGRIALELHREMESMRPERNELMEEFETILTPEQVDRLGALRAAREFAGPRDGHPDRAPRPSPEGN